MQHINKHNAMGFLVKKSTLANNEFFKYSWKLFPKYISNMLRRVNQKDFNYEILHLGEI